MTSPRKTSSYYIGAAAMAALLLVGQISCAGTLRDRFIDKRLDELTTNEAAAKEEPVSMAALPADTQVVRDVPYGSDEKQRFDVYIPKGARNAPVVFMVHGGAWAIGDKSSKTVVLNKANRWLPKGFVLITPNYRLLPKADPLEQASDVAKALAAAQDKAASWGADRAKFILMGHSAGAHLVSLLATKPSLTAGLGVTPWLGTVSLDSAAFNVVDIMEAKHYRFYDRAFGTDTGYWKAASPYYALSARMQPLLMTCTTKREDACPQANQFAAKANSLGMRTSVVQKDFSHKEMNELVGADPNYTAAVESFLASLDSTVAAALSGAGAKR